MVDCITVTIKIDEFAACLLWFIVLSEDLKKHNRWERRGMANLTLKGLSHEIDFKNVDENGQILALLRAAAGFWIFSEAPLIFCWEKTSVSR